jgi:uncharacterized protein YjeT (DUF2065 family)
VWTDLIRAVALLLVLEGIMPFVMPSRWRENLLRMASLNDRVLRFVGLTSMTIGLVILQLARYAR